MFQRLKYKQLTTPDGTVRSDRDSTPLRLLTLLPGRWHEPLTFRLENHVLGTAPEYAALSYCWYAVPGTDKVWTEDGASYVEVTMNAIHALQGLRDLCIPRLVRIDAICINQDDLEERARQVEVMKYIFSSARMTVVWLGASESRVLAYSGLVDMLAQARRKISVSSQVFPMDPRDRQRLMSIGGVPPKENYEIELALLVDLLNSPWFTRSWVIQEAILSKQVILRQGNFEITFEDLASAFMLIYELGWMQPSSKQTLAVLCQLLAIAGGRKGAQANEFMPLLDLLCSFRSARTTDPRDKIYSVLGMTSHKADSAMITYARDVGDVYRQWTLSMIAADQNLDVLSTVGVFERHDSIVQDSWVTDWYSLDDNQAEIMAVNPRLQYHATPSSTIAFRYDNESRILSLHGVLIGTITATGLAMQNSHDHEQLDSGSWYTLRQANRIFASWEAVGRLRSEAWYSHSDESRRDAYWQTLLFPMQIDLVEDKISMRERFDDWHNWTRKPHYWYESIHLHYFWPTYLLCFAITMLYMELILRWTEFPHDQILSFTTSVPSLAGWRMLRLNTGYIGRGPGRSRPGDYVALFKGGRAPLVVRRDGDHWKLVGAAFVHGLMRGEGWDESLCRPFMLR